jgi:hypothetical protein
VKAVMMGEEGRSNGSGGGAGNKKIKTAKMTE